jgi:hypothetical protein
MLRHVVRGAALSATLFLLSGGSALAASNGAGTETITEHFRNEVLFSEPETVNPCTGEPGTLTGIAKNGKVHATAQADGELWVTGTFGGTVTLTPAEPGGVSASGHFTSWFGVSLNQKNSVEHSTGTFHLTGSDGSTVKMHMVEHISTNAKGEITVSFEKARLNCG